MNQSRYKIFSITIGIVLISFFALSLSVFAESPKFSPGDRVRANVSSLNVRVVPFGSKIGTISLNSLGTIRGDLVTSGNANWWKINWDSGLSGYSSEGDGVEQFLIKTSGSSLLQKIASLVVSPTIGEVYGTSTKLGDFILRRVVITPSNPKFNENLSMDALVVRKGTLPSKTAILRIRIDAKGDGTWDIVKNISSGDLSIKKNVKISVPNFWKTTMGLYRIEVCIDGQNLVPELNEKNNCKTSELTIKSKNVPRHK